MKITFLISAAATLLNIQAIDQPICNNQENKMSSPCSNGTWNQGKIPYEISKEFDGKDLNLIKEALFDFMKTTCIKFVPRSNEADYVVFMEYNQPNQEKRTCWSGNKRNNGSITVGNQKGRHIVSLWRDLECFNKLDIIRLMSGILGFQTKSSTLILKSGRSLIHHGAYKFYEEDFGKDKKQNTTKNIFMQSCEKEKKLLRNHPYAADNKGWVQIARNDTCNVLRSTIEINRIYNCSATSNPADEFLNNTLFGHTRPICKTEAEAGTCKSDPIYMGMICDKSYCNNEGNISYQPRMRRLVNGFGKGIFPYGGSKKSNFTLHQGDPNHTLWSWNETSLGSGDRHLCNSLGKCATSYKIDPVRPRQPPAIKQDDYTNKGDQRFDFLELPADPGFFIIKDEFGKCLAVNGNTDWVMSAIRPLDCKPSEAGQRWKWSYP